MGKKTEITPLEKWKKQEKEKEKQKQQKEKLKIKKNHSDEKSSSSTSSTSSSSSKKTLTSNKKTYENGQLIPSFILEIEKLNKLAKSSKLSTADKEKLKRLQGQHKALNIQREAQDLPPLELPSSDKKQFESSEDEQQTIKKRLELLKNPPLPLSSSSESNPIFIHAEPVLRNLQKESISFVPSVLRTRAAIQKKTLS